MELSYVFSAIMGIIGIFLLGLTYTYIDKLEKVGCECAKHPYRNYIKGYTIFAIIYMAIMFLLPVSAAVKTMGKEFGYVYMLANLIFVVVTVIFFVYSLIYTRHLMKEKCKCSEDVRREVLYLWSIIEVIWFALILIIPTLTLLVAGSVGIASGMVDLAGSKESLVREAVVNPVRSIQRIPKAIRELPKSFKKYKK